MVMAVRARIRNVHYQLRNNTNTIAALMVLFLALIAAILYLNEKELQENHSIIPAPISTGTMPVYQSPSPSPLIHHLSDISPTPTAVPAPLPSLLPNPSPLPNTIPIAKPDTGNNASAVEALPDAVSTVIPDSEYDTRTDGAMPDAVPTVNPDAGSNASADGTLPDTAPTAKPVAPTLPPPLPTPSQETVLKKVLVVIDPGHGGIDPGTCSIYRENFYEKNINLDIAIKLKTLLEQSRIPVLLTRESDVEVIQSGKYDANESIRERSEIANRNHATLFISIHVNAYDTKIPGGERHHGTEIYHAGKTHGAFTSRQFAEIMGKAVDKKTETRYNGVIERKFGVLRLSEMPALLIETAYLTNKEDHKLLESNDFRSNMAGGIHDGIVEILKTMGAYKKDETWCILVKE